MWDTCIQLTLEKVSLYLISKVTNSHRYTQVYLDIAGIYTTAWHIYVLNEDIPRCLWHGIHWELPRVYCLQLTYSSERAKYPPPPTTSITPVSLLLPHDHCHHPKPNKEGHWRRTSWRSHCPWINMGCRKSVTSFFMWETKQAQKHARPRAEGVRQSSGCSCHTEMSTETLCCRRTNK